MAQAAIAASSQLRARQQAAKRARGQGEQSSRPRPQGIQPQAQGTNALPGRNDAFNREETRTLPTSTLSEAFVYQPQIDAAQAAQEQREWLAEQNRKRLEDYMRALAPIPQVFTPSRDTSQVDRVELDRMRRSYRDLYARRRQASTQSKQRVLKQKMQKVKQKAAALKKKEALENERAKNRDLLVTTGSITSSAEAEGAAGWTIVNSGGLTSLFKIVKKIMGIDYVFHPVEPTLSIDDIDLRGLISGTGTIIHGSLYVIVFLGIIVLGIVNLIIGIVGMSILAPLALAQLYDLFSPFLSAFTGV